jgi:hypothetical protein
VIIFLAGAVGTRTQPGGRRRAATQRTNERTAVTAGGKLLSCAHTHTRFREKGEMGKKKKKCFGYVFSRLLPIPWLGMMAAIIAGGKRGRSSLGAAQSCTISSQPTHRSPPASSSYINLLARVCLCVCIDILHMNFFISCVCVCLIFSSNFLLPGKKVGGYLTQFLHLSLKEFPPSLTTPPPLRPAKAKKPKKKIRKRREI